MNKSQIICSFGENTDIHSIIQPGLAQKVDIPSKPQNRQWISKKNNQLLVSSTICLKDLKLGKAKISESNLDNQSERQDSMLCKTLMGSFKSGMPKSSRSFCYACSDKNILSSEMMLKEAKPHIPVTIAEITTEKKQIVEEPPVDDAKPKLPAPGSNKLLRAFTTALLGGKPEPPAPKGIQKLEFDLMTVQYFNLTLQHQTQLKTNCKKLEYQFNRTFRNKTYGEEAKKKQHLSTLNQNKWYLILGIPCLGIFIENPSQIKWESIREYVTIKNSMIIDVQCNQVYQGDIQVCLNEYELILIRKASTKMESDWHVSLKYPVEVYDLDEVPPTALF